MPHMRGMVQPSRGCWTCKDRKVLCDRAVPVCGNCTRVNRTCLGYGVRLSWPDDSEHRRSIVVAPNNPAEDEEKGPIQFVNMTYWHIELYNHIADSAAFLYPRSKLQRIITNGNSLPFGLDGELLLYFKLVASQALTPFAGREGHLAGILLHFALRDDSSASRAVRSSILALSWIHRDGYHYDANQLKVQAIGDMRSSMQEEALDQTKPLQHIAASMLLCSFEIFLPSESSFQWPEYISGVKQIIETLPQYDSSLGYKLSELVCWIYYHDVLSVFSLQHWKRISVEKEHLLQCQRITLRSLLSPTTTKINIIFGCSLAMLDLLAAVFEFCHQLIRSSTLSVPDRKKLVGMIGKLEEVQQIVGSEEERNQSHVRDIAELFRLAALIYLYRVCERPTQFSVSVASCVDDAFVILSRLQICERPFPLTLIGCEARTDSERQLILAVISNTQNEANVRSYACIRRFVESFWNLDDLDGNDSICYMTKMDLVTSSSDFLPTFI